MGCALSTQGSRLVGALLLPSRQVSRSALCATFRPTHQLDSPAGRGLGRATLTRSVSLQAPPWEPLSVVLEFWVWLPLGTGGTLVFPSLSRAGLENRLVIGASLGWRTSR